jgi:hypothetical protein
VRTGAAVRQPYRQNARLWPHAAPSVLLACGCCSSA